MQMFDYKVTQKRSFLGNVYYLLIRLSRMKNKLAKDSFSRLHSYEDVKTPAKKSFVKEVIGDTTAYWINKEKSENGILVFLPGGGFVIGPSKLHWVYCEKMSKELDMAVLVIRYGLAPEHAFPDSLNGIVNVITTLQNRGDLKQNWFLAGDSAGGNLALTTCYKLYELKAVLPKKLMLIYPSVDMNSDNTGPKEQEIIRKDVVLSLDFTKRILAAYAGNQDINQPLLSPVNGPVEILPPVLLQHGNNDILIRGTQKLVQRMQAAGKSIQYEEYEGMFHGFLMIPNLPETKLAIRSQLQFLRK
jgi:monoterpene epsilon-lactone hydrolase